MNAAPYSQRHISSSQHGPVTYITEVLSNHPVQYCPRLQQFLFHILRFSRITLVSSRQVTNRRRYMLPIIANNTSVLRTILGNPIQPLTVFYLFQTTPWGPYLCSDSALILENFTSSLGTILWNLCIRPAPWELLTLDGF